MKLIIKLAVTALFANALFRLGTEYLVYYKFRDSVREEAMFRAKNDEELGPRVMEIAETYGVPLAPGGFTIRRNAREAVVEGSYVKPIELAPGFPYPWRFDFLIQAYLTNVPLLPGAPQPKPAAPTPR
jgi:hypothetical protein